MCVCRIYAVVKLYLCFAIFTSYALQFYVPITILEGVIKQTRISRYQRFPYILRTVAVVGTGKLADDDNNSNTSNVSQCILFH